MRRTTLEVGGLIAMLDFLAVEKRLQALPGVIAVDMNATSTTASVAYDETRTDAETIRRAIEACGFRDAYADLKKQGAVVLGVSRDSTKSHAKFRAAQKLPFNLLSDPNGDAISAYGSWGEKSFMGRKSMGILRTTVLIDRTGTIRKVYPKVSPKTHAAEVLKDLEALG